MGSRAGDSRVSGAPAYGLGRSLVRSGGQMVRGGGVGLGGFTGPGRRDFCYCNTFNVGSNQYIIPNRAPACLPP
jgi:hypothetical protein